ncbi:FUSC family protein [Rhodococcus sp. NPDC127528]|uniref:FUSC family protein n=1 Tax=unclassified Rhodococcus (in: high G+C Gram-positive bacteria) TaxID=192944 RepID=UPI0036453082
MHGVLAHARGLVAVGPAANDHLHALRVAVGLALPGLALLAGGRPDLMIYAVFGAVTGMYGRTDPHRQRVAHQAQAAAILVAGVGTGVLLSSVHARPWVLVVAMVVFASVGSLVTDRLGLAPEGPFFGIFALGAVAAVPADQVAPWAALSICAATALLCLLISFASSFRARVRDREAVPARSRPSGTLVHAARYASAISIAGVGGLLLGIDHANWAMAAAAVPLAAADPFSRVHRGLHRIVGTFAGLAVAAVLLLPHPSETLLGVCVMALLFPTELFMARHYALALGFFTPLIMVMTDLAAPAEPLALLAYRGIDTVIGVGAGIAVALIIRGPGRATTAALDSPGDDARQAHPRQERIDHE